MKFSFVDIETTGAHSRHDRIIEIGILRVEDNTLKKTYQQLINPETYLNPFISKMTGITETDLEKAPTFEELKEEILEMIDDTIFVAHNVRFDYGFIRNEFKRFGIDYSAKQFCTVKLSRKLFPQYPKHNLDSLIERFNFEMENRHRAFDDAKVLWDFYQKVNTLFPSEKLNTVVSEIIKKPTIPQHISKKVINTLPEGPGVYIFYGDNDVPLYIGKSVNIRDRVLSHFSNDHTSAKELKISKQVKNIETITTVGEFGALIKEAALVKEMNPLYNTQLRKTPKKYILKKKERSDRFFSIDIEQIEQIHPVHLDTLLGIFPSRKKAKEYLEKKAGKYQLCPKLLCLEKGKGACFASKIEKCKGGCSSKEHFLSYNMRFIQAFSDRKIKTWPFNGPIRITEIDSVEQKSETFLADKWCLVDPGSRELIFDYDTYKILVKYVFKHRNQARIRKVNETEIQSLQGV